MSGKILFYVQHLLGVGHVARAAAIARGLAKAGLDVEVVLGGEPVPNIDFGGARTRQLAPARALDMSFSILVDENSRPVDDAWRQRRQTELAEAYAAIRPEVLLIEHFPFGRRNFSFELEPLFAQAKADRCRIVGSIRDVLVHKADGSPNQAKKTAKILTLLRQWFDRVLVHGDPAVVPFTATFPAAAEIADLLTYTGYVVDRRQQAAHNRGATRPAASATTGGAERAADGEDEIIVSIGGGAVGETLLRTALAARLAGCQPDRVWRLLAGANLDPSVFAELTEQARHGIIIERARPDFQQLLQRSALSISQAGYNTLMDVMAADCRALMVPFAAGAETEQLYRARIFEERGLIQVLEEGVLDSATLGDAVNRALAGRNRQNGPPSIDLSGVETTARLIAAEALRAKEQRV